MTRAYEAGWRHVQSELEVGDVVGRDGEVEGRVLLDHERGQGGVGEEEMAEKDGSLRAVGTRAGRGDATGMT